jgi:hypothetical protein
MRDKADSLRVAFGLDDESMREIRAKVAASRAAVELARGALSRSAPALLEGAVGEVHDRIDEILSTPVSAILADAWRAYAPFFKYCDPVKYPPGDTAEVELDTHTVRSSLRPYVEVVVDGKRVGRIDFQVDVEVRLDAAILVIRYGRFMELRAGRSTFAGRFAVEEVVLAQTEKRFPLPGSISFGEDGIPIRPGVAPAPTEAPVAPAPDAVVPLPP